MKAIIILSFYISVSQSLFGESADYRSGKYLTSRGRDKQQNQVKSEWSFNIEGLKDLTLHSFIFITFHKIILTALFMVYSF